MLAGSAATVDAIKAKRGARLVVRDADLTGADFTGVSLRRVCFEQTDLSRSNFEGARLSDVVFAYSTLPYANFTDASFRDVDFLNSELEGLRGRRLDWHGGRLAGGRVDAMLLAQAILTDIERRCGGFEGEYPWRYSGSDADLAGARLDRFRWSGYLPADLTGATVRNAVIELGQVEAYGVARVEGAITLGAYDAERTLRLSQADWRELKAAFPPSFAPRRLDDCSSRPRPASSFLCRPDSYGLLPAAAYVLDSMSQIKAFVLEARLTTEADEARALLPEVRCLADVATASDCLFALYRDRSDVLMDTIQRSNPFPPGETVVFAETPAFSQGFSATPLYDRLRPLLLDSARAVILVTGTPGGVALQGWAAGSNGHSCDAEGTLTLGAKGWYGGRAGDEGWQDVLRILGDRAWLADNDIPDYVGCGARAGFDVMRRIPASPAMVERLKQDWGG